MLLRRVWYWFLVSIYLQTYHINGKNTKIYKKKTKINKIHFELVLNALWHSAWSCSSGIPIPQRLFHVTLTWQRTTCIFQWSLEREFMYFAGKLEYLNHSSFQSVSYKIFICIVLFFGDDQENNKPKSYDQINYIISQYSDVHGQLMGVSWFHRWTIEFDYFFHLSLKCIFPVKLENDQNLFSSSTGSRTTQPVDSSARSVQLGPYVPDNSARRCNYTECLSRELNNKILVIYCLFEVIYHSYGTKVLSCFFFYFNFKWSHKITYS